MSRLRIFLFVLLLGGAGWVGAVRADSTSPAHEYRTKAYPEPHGKTLCASGCALSRHPTPALTQERYQELLQGYLEHNSEKALDELLYFGSQTRLKLGQDQNLKSGPELDLLKKELERNRVLVSFRLVDAEGLERVRMPAMSVPLDIRHVFEPLQAVDVQPPEASGTVKRVGLNHIWQRI